MIFRDEQRIKAVFRADKWRHAREQFELFARYLDISVALRLICEESHCLVDQNREGVLRVRVKLSLRQVENVLRDIVVRVALVFVHS